MINYSKQLRANFGDGISTFFEWTGFILGGIVLGAVWAVWTFFAISLSNRKRMMGPNDTIIDSAVMFRWIFTCVLVVTYIVLVFTLPFIPWTAIFIPVITNIIAWVISVFIKTHRELKKESSDDSKE